MISKLITFLLQVFKNDLNNKNIILIKMTDYPQKILTIHFPNKEVYIENTSKSLLDKMKVIKNDKDHYLYQLLKDYPNPEIRFECFQNCDCSKEFCVCSKKTVASEYIKDYYKILNPKLFPSPSLIQSLYKWMGY